MSLMTKKLLVLLIICITFSSCSRPTSRENEVIGMVLQHVFDLSGSTPMLQTMDQGQSQALPSEPKVLEEQSSSDFDSQLSHLYQSYFTEKGYTDFVNNRYPLKYILQAKSSDCTLKIAKLHIEQDKKNLNYYTFTCDILITFHNNDTLTVQENGTALFEGDNTNKVISTFWLSENCLGKM